jgi:hypothetical protein
MRKNITQMKGKDGDEEKGKKMKQKARQERDFVLCRLHSS